MAAEGACCTDTCCGPGSYCCARANPHTHDEGGDLAHEAQRETDREREAPYAAASNMAVDAAGYVWRVFDRDTPGEMWSMAPVNPDNSPLPRPVTWYVPEPEGGE